MELNYFDLIASVIILLLGLKGIINGFFKEAFGLLGIVGGIFIASRLGDKVGLYLSNMIFKFENTAAISFTGFLATLAAFWILMILLGMVFKKISSLSGLGPVDKLLGFVFGASKFFLIAAVIAHAAFNIKVIQSTIQSTMKTSVLFPILVSTGGYIMKLEPIEISQDSNTTFGENTQEMQDKIQEALDNSTLQIVKETKEELKNIIPANIREGNTSKSELK